MKQHTLTMKLYPGAGLVAAALGLLLLTPWVAVGADGQSPLLPNGGFETLDSAGRPEGWTEHLWGEAEKASCVPDGTVSHGGGTSLKATLEASGTMPGVFTQRSLEAGQYVVRVYVRAAQGARAAVRMYVADQYSPPFIVGDQWTELSWRHEVRRRMFRAEVNVQLVGPAPGTAWLDDVSLEVAPRIEPRAVPDTRPLDAQPRLLYSGGNFGYQRDTAADWAGRGFGGFVFPYVMADWASSPWAEDGVPETKGDEDKLLAEARGALRTLREAGVSDNAMRVPVVSLPALGDEAAWAGVVSTLREGAAFARPSGMSMLVLDTKLVTDEMSPQWKGWAESGLSPGELAQRMALHWKAVGQGLAETDPNLSIGLTPETGVFGGRLWDALFRGLVAGLREGGLRGRLNVMCQGTFLLRDVDAIRDHAATVRAHLSLALRGADLAWWDQHGGVALGAWPLGYYRPIMGEGGKFLGWSGTREAFAGELVGPYADKSSRYSAEEFQRQLAALRTYSDGFVWINGLGASWWQVPTEKADYYAAQMHRFARGNELAPTTGEVESYYQATSRREVIEEAVP